MEYTIKGLAELAGVTTRTLRWYDGEGLLKPARVTAAGYRMYGPAQVDRLQQILFYRELGLELAAIRRLLDDPDFDTQAALQSHLGALEARRDRLNTLILTVKKTLKGADTMSDQEKFEGFKARLIQENKEKYGAELRERYGDAVVDKADNLLAGLTQEQYWAMTSLEQEIREKLEAAVRAGAAPAGEVGLDIAMLHKTWLGYSWGDWQYTPQAHRGLAELYTGDPRFTAYYDGKVPGCAAFLREAILSHM